jgi:hypothetical protein
LTCKNTRLGSRGLAPGACVVSFGGLSYEP